MIELHCVSVTKGRSKILKDVELSIRAGERIVILGPNGSGKSSLIKVMLGEYRPDMSVPGSYVKIRERRTFTSSTSDRPSAWLPLTCRSSSPGT